MPLVRSVWELGILLPWRHVRLAASVSIRDILVCPLAWAPFLRSLRMLFNISPISALLALSPYTSKTCPLLPLGYSLNLFSSPSCHSCLGSGDSAAVSTLQASLITESQLNKPALSLPPFCSHLPTAEPCFSPQHVLPRNP